MTKIKLCGMTRFEDIEAANMLMPDYVGFVFAKKSRRYITPEAASDFRKKLNQKIGAVGVFVDEEPAKILELVNAGIIQIIQLHGKEDENYTERLKNFAQCPIIKAFGIKSERDILAAMKSPADYVMLDSQTGGTGTSFDWALVKKINRPYFLAGGLGPENVAKAVIKYRPYAVDVSSGIETDGFKDINKMKEFVHAVNCAERKAGEL